MRLLLLRHCEVVWQPDDHHGLTPDGMRQAGEVGDLLAVPSIASIYSSPARRAIETVSPLATRLNLEIQVSERELTAQSKDNFLSACKRTWDDFDFSFPGGESNREATSRARDFIDKLCKKHDTDEIVLSTHGTLLSLILEQYVPHPGNSYWGFDFWRGLTMPDIYRLILEVDRSHFERIWQDTPARIDR